MENPAFAKTLMIVGIIIVLISAFADPIGFGRSPGFGWRQTLGVIVGALVILGGLYLRRRRKPAP
jgi:LPXTG-motif cell wall-anchored protein